MRLLTTLGALALVRTIGAFGLPAAALVLVVRRRWRAAFTLCAVGAVFLLPWAVVFRELGMLAFVEGLVFIVILVVALAYVWRKGGLEWDR